MLKSSSAARAICVALVSLVAAPTVAQSVGDWRSVPAVTPLPALNGFSLGELGDGSLLLLGSQAGVPNAVGYVWDGVDWAAAATAPPMPPRNHAAMAQYGPFGPAHGSILVVYGGMNGASILTDLYLTYDALTWQGGASGGPVLTNTSMAADLEGGRMVLLGKNLQGQYATWFYNMLVFAPWVAGPTFAASDARVVEDSVRGEVLLLEGGFPNVAVSRLHNDNWQLLETSAQRMSLGEVAFDERRARTVIVQPFDTLDTVEWDGIGFGPITLPAGQFLSPSTTAMSYSSVRGETILVADLGNGLQTFRHAADAEPTATAFGDACGLSPTLELAAGSLPRPGTSHILEATLSQSALGLSVLGLSHVTAGAASLPQVLPFGTGACELLVDPAVVTYLGSGTQFSHLVSIPASSVLLAERYNAQVLAVDATSFGTSSGLELQIGEPLVEQVLVESFVDGSNRDELTSGDGWGNGATFASRVGGDGRHGSFSLELGTNLGGGVYEFDTDSTLIPASNTMSNVDQLVTDGRFYFTDFVVPVNTTVRFVGSVAVQLFVRGETNVMGTVSVDGHDLPSQLATSGLAAGQQVSTFGAYQSLTGQAGSEGGPGGARGGNGGDRCNNLGPTISGGVNVTNGQPGEDVRIGAGHAYLGAALGTGGRGSELTPSTGVWALPTPTVGGTVYCAYFSPGGSGGGFYTPGASVANPVYTGFGTGVIVPGAIAPGGAAFPVSPYPASPPAGYSSLQHYAVGGSGGGGGGSHGYGVIVLTNPAQKWMAGHAGSGGGGVLVIRSGGEIDVPGELSSRGGDAPLINGSNFGIGSPGGGGSGGSILLQCDRITLAGAIDTSGGTGSEVGFVDNGLRRASAKAGDGASGNFRLEGWSVNVWGASTPQYNSQNHRGLLHDKDAVTGSRSKWMRPASSSLPTYLRYEVVATVDGLPVLYSSDPAVSPLAADDPSGFVMLRFQGAQTDPLTGNPIPGTEGPWRTDLTGLGSLNADRAQAVRFDLLTNKSSATTVSVLEVRIVWR